MKYVIMTQPTRRYDQAKYMVPELLQLGRLLAQFFNDAPEKIAVIISADLAHTHTEEGPYGYSKTAEIFDNLIEKWIISGGKNPSLLLSKATEILDEALACGFTGLVLLQGILEIIPLKPKLLASSHPTYYGMAVATYQQEENV
jgi:aromatic ring-opening dioxygenase LigB subunit